MGLERREKVQRDCEERRDGKLHVKKKLNKKLCFIFAISVDIG